MLFALIALLGTILGCAKTEEFKAPDTPTITESNISVGKVILGKRCPIIFDQIGIFQL